MAFFPVTAQIRYAAQVFGSTNIDTALPGEGSAANDSSDSEQRIIWTTEEGYARCQNGQRLVASLFILYTWRGCGLMSRHLFRRRHATDMDHPRRRPRSQIGRASCRER